MFKELAEREGFEPPIPVKVYTLSRRAPSATRPSLRAANFIPFYQGSCWLECSPPTSLNRAGINLLIQTNYAVFDEAAGELDVEGGYPVFC